VSNYTRLEVLDTWQKTSIAQKLAGDQYWQFGWYGWSYGPNNDDGFTIFLNESDAKVLVNEHARHVSDLNH
jgi:mannan endo-1,4-beta-mannosidase